MTWANNTGREIRRHASQFSAGGSSRALLPLHHTAEQDPGEGSVAASEAPVASSGSYEDRERRSSDAGHEDRQPSAMVMGRASPRLEMSQPLRQLRQIVQRTSGSGCSLTPTGRSATRIRARKSIWIPQHFLPSSMRIPRRSSNSIGFTDSTIANMKRTACIVLGICLGFAASTNAQSYTVQKPGELPTYVRPSPGGGWTITTPGQLPTYVRPNPGGGETIISPGQLPTYVRPSHGDGWTITAPGQLPTYVRPNPSGSGHTIITPGQLPTYMRPSPGGGYTAQKPGELPVYIWETP